MASVVRSTVEITVKANEYNTDAALDGGPPAKLPHPFRFVDTTDYEVVWSDTLSLTTTPTDLALDALTSKLTGAALAMGTLHVVGVRHVSGAGNAEVGGDALPVSLTDGDTEAILVRPGGAILLDLGTAGAAVANGATDILQLAASAGTVVVEVLLLGNEPA